MLSASVRYFPLVGSAVGLAMGATVWFASYVVPVSVAVVLALIIGVLCTGAFHEDGVADVADSAGAFSIDRKLEIMRDSRVGTYGSLALILCVLMRFVLLSELAQISILAATAALVLAHSSSRWSSVYLMANVAYARPEGGNAVVAQGVDQLILKQATLCLFAIVTLTLFSLLWQPTGVLLALLVTWPLALLVSKMCGYYFMATFKGVTGDCLGAANIVVELVTLFAVLSIYNFDPS